MKPTTSNTFLLYLTSSALFISLIDLFNSIAEATLLKQNYIYTTQAHLHSFLLQLFSIYDASYFFVLLSIISGILLFMLIYENRR